MGCGNGHTAIKLAAIAGPAGRVVGVDADPGVLEVARQEAARGARPVEFREADALNLGEADTYDLAYARFLLTHLPDPEKGLQSLIGATRPGGIVAVEDIDFHSYFSYPLNQSFDRYVELYRETGLRTGADPLIGPRLVGMFLDSGLEDVDFHTVEPLFREGPGKAIPQLTMEHIRESVVASGLGTNAEVDQIVADLDVLRLDPRSLMGYPRVFQVWGRKPRA